VAFIFSFISFYVADIDTSGNCPSIITDQISRAEDAAGSASAWHGFFAWFGVLAALVGAGLLAVAIFAPQVKMPFSARFAAVIAWAVAVLCLFLALFITPGLEGDNTATIGSCKLEGSVGHGVGYWVTFIAVIAGLVLTVLAYRQGGGQLPGLGSKSGHGHAATTAGGPGSFPQQTDQPQQRGYAPPQPPQSPPAQGPPQQGGQQYPPPQQGGQQYPPPQQGGQQYPPPQQGGQQYPPPQQ
jgi:hypothetical protein